MDRQPKAATFYCFTPLVSLATFFIEFGLALYVIFRYKLTPFSRLAALLILLLGIFQLSEYALCSWPNALLWAKVGTASVTLLPVISLHMVTLITRRSKWIWVGYGLGIGFILAILFSPYVVLNTLCTGKFVVIDPRNNTYVFTYTAYYFIFLVIGVEMLIRSLLKHKGDRQELIWAVVGYMSFIVPTFVVYVFIAFTRSGVASVMCGFAVLMAVILVAKELPRYYQVKKIE